MELVILSSLGLAFLETQRSLEPVSTRRVKSGKEINEVHREVKWGTSTAYVDISNVLDGQRVTCRTEKNRMRTCILYSFSRVLLLDDPLSAVDVAFTARNEKPLKVVVGAPASVSIERADAWLARSTLTRKMDENMTDQLTNNMNGEELYVPLP